MQVSFAKFSMPRSGALVVTVLEKGALTPSAAQVDADLGGFVKRAITAGKFEGRRGAVLDLINPNRTGPERIVLLGLGAPSAITLVAAEALGGALCGHLQQIKAESVALALDPVKGLGLEDEAFAAHVALGADLRDYRFDRYRTRKDDKAKSTALKLTVMTDAATGARALYTHGAAGVAGTKLARDLVTEPPNVLFPKEFAKRCQALSKLGVTVELLDEKQMAKLGMGALLGVGQGSAKDSYLVVMSWAGKSGGRGKAKGKGKKGATLDQPIAFIGKGVTFDTGGISLKPGGGMEDMKGDMGGAAAVTGLMHALAARKANVDAVGVIGLVENMPDADAQRPGDIVTSMSGQTIEIINTDAEGRLVLADALWYTQDRFKPRFMIDLATLTGAIIVSLAHDYAGMFTDDETLGEQLCDAGEATGDKVWRLPMGDYYDKMIDSQFADMKNTGGRAGGSISAAQFLKRFTNGIPWVHLDIAGTSNRSKPTETIPGWASGYGVRLLDRLVADHYEGAGRPVATRQPVAKKAAVKKAMVKKAIVKKGAAKKAVGRTVRKRRTA